VGDVASNSVCVETQKNDPVDDWSGGYFSASSCQLPRACLDRCLQGNPNLATTHGCAMIQQLVHTQGDPTDNQHQYHEDTQVPLFCKQGYRVSLFVTENHDSPNTLILLPPSCSELGYDTLNRAIDALRAATVENWRLNRENEGLANEVLQCYEQVNLIFDISGNVAVLTDASDIRLVLLQKLRYIYDADGVFYLDETADKVIHVNRDGHTTEGQASAALASLTSNDLVRDDPSPITLPPEAESAVHQIKSSPRVFALAGHDDSRGHGTSIWGPLRQGVKELAIVGAVRRHKPFEAGDMLLLDSTLTFGGHILSNMQFVDRLKKANFEAVRALVNAIDQKDRYTSGHSERVGFLAKATGTFMGLPAEKLQQLEWGGLLHDIGKIGIPESVLNKPGVLSDEEFAIIKDHPARGYAVLKPVESLEGVLDLVLHHHETPDGTGYPDGLKGDQIPLPARILHVADTFDALTSTRSYRKAFDTERAIQILRKDAGLKLDPEAVECFLGAWQNLSHDFPDEYQRWFGSRKEEAK